MKKLIGIIFILFMFGTANAEDIRSPVKEISLDIASAVTLETSSGITTALNQSATVSGISWFFVNGTNDIVSMKEIGPNLGVFAIQVYSISLALENQSGESFEDSSGATYELYYQGSMIDNDDLWAGSGVTLINSTMALSGSTPVTQHFAPEFYTFYRIGVLSGMTQFGTFRARLGVQ